MLALLARQRQRQSHRLSERLTITVPNTEDRRDRSRLTTKTMRAQSHEDYVPFTAKVWALKGFCSNMGRSKYERGRRWKWRGNYAGEGEHLMAARQGDSWC